ncbi:hypothetical protein [Paenibacillus terrigena]|uniref:hypothetical protein n=1 Tax=Paenibacillus terrigena TaxID=369333 RepID=UPI0028D27CDF|nr:hypothetical protein [Paenibacillus terrigena]
MASSQHPNTQRNDLFNRDHKHLHANQRHPYLDLSIQQWAVIIALFSNALFIESVIINRNKTIQVILAGDFSKMTGAFSPNNLTDDSLALFEALEAAEEATHSHIQHHHPPHRGAVEKKSVVKSKKKKKRADKHR